MYISTIKSRLKKNRKIINLNYFTTYKQQFTTR